MQAIDSMDAFWRRISFGLIGLGALAAAGSPVAFAQSKTTIADPNWASGRAISALIRVIITDKIGGEADQVPGTNSVVFQAMDRGKGEIDVHPDVWLPNQKNFTDEYVEAKGTVALSKNGYDGRAGFCMSKAFSVKHAVNSVFDLATPEISRLMDSDGDGKGEIWIGAPGWASTNANAVKARDYGITGFFETVEAEEVVATAMIKDAEQKDQGIAFYCYEPHYNWFLFDMVMLDEPEFDEAGYKLLQPAEDPDWFTKSKIMTGDKPKKIHVGYSKTLEQRSPAVAEFLSQIALDTETVNRWTYEIVVKKREPQEVAREWVAANSERVDGWLGL